MVTIDYKTHINQCTWDDFIQLNFKSKITMFGLPQRHITQCGSKWLKLNIWQNIRQIHGKKTKFEFRQRQSIRKKGY